MSPRLRRIAELAASDKELAFTSLAHNLDVEMLYQGYTLLRKDAASGADGQTAEAYSQHLGENLSDLHYRLRTRTYRAIPVKRVWIDKEDGKKRPIGMTSLEDKIVERAVVLILEQIYEQDFYEFSQGYRPEKGAHQALKMLREFIMKHRIESIVDADISGCFDNLDHGVLRTLLKRRVKDGGILRLIGKWLKAGVIEGKTLSYPEKGSPQGAVISPLLANIYLHYVLDEWFVKDILPRLKGKAFLVRYADDFVIAFEYESDAKRVLEVLPKRMEKYKLTIHPKKTRLVSFKRPPQERERCKGSETFDFLGFTHYWAKSRSGQWVIKRQTARKRLRRAVRAINEWCRENRHMDVKEQYRKLCQKLKGHYQYYGVRSNYRSLGMVYDHARKLWRKWLSRRSQKAYLNWEKFEIIQTKFSLPMPRIIHQFV
jgi:group II intron reverse transcriptase/maturase